MESIEPAKLCHIAALNIIRTEWKSLTSGSEPHGTKNDCGVIRPDAQPEPGEEEWQCPKWLVEYPFI